MTKKQFPGVKLVFYRTLYSQSAASVTMGSIASFLRHHGHSVELCLLRRSASERNELHTCGRLLSNAEKYPVVIAKPNFKDYSELLPLLERAKDQGIFRRVFLCGPFASLNAKDMMARLKWLDGIIIGEPEETALELCNSFSDKLDSWDFKTQGGIWRKPNTEEVVQGGLRTPRWGLDELPPPARDIEEREKASYINLEASRGCRCSCSFCHVPLYLPERKKRLKNPKRIVDEIEHLYTTLSKRLFIFNDSLFWSDKTDDKRVLELCDEIRRRKLDIRFYIYLRCCPFPGEKIVGALADAGLARVFLGVENATESGLKVFQKNVRLDELRDIQKRLEKHGINVHLGFITFHPYASLDDIKENLEFLHSIGKLVRMGIIVEPVRVITGSAMHKMLVKDKLMEAELPYDQITYGYRFCDNRVGNLLKSIRSVFFDTLDNRGYDVEYYCISGRLLQSLVERRASDVEKQHLAPCFQRFDDMYNGWNLFMYETLNKFLKLARAGNNEGEICRKVLKKTFIGEYKKRFFDLQISWANMVDGVKQSCDEKIIEEVFTGVE